MDKQLVNKIRQASKIIIKKVSEDDVLIFIGQSPNLIYHLVKKFRESYELPFSGSYAYLKTVEFDEKKSMDFFRSMLDHYKITKDVLKKNVYLVDYCVSGITIQSVISILNKCFGLSKAYGLIYWTNASSNIENLQMINKKIWLDELMNTKLLDALINFEEIEKRTIPTYNFYKEYDGTFFEEKKCDTLEKFYGML
jgi:hypothetical protein